MVPKRESKLDFTLKEIQRERPCHDAHTTTMHTVECHSYSKTTNGTVINWLYYDLVCFRRQTLLFTHETVRNIALVLRRIGLSPKTLLIQVAPGIFKSLLISSLSGVHKSIVLYLITSSLVVF